MGLDVKHRPARDLDYLSQQSVQHSMLEHIGAVSGVIAVLIGEHGLSVLKPDAASRSPP
jgi:hypothetical protein